MYKIHCGTVSIEKLRQKLDSWTEFTSYQVITYHRALPNIVLHTRRQTHSNALKICLALIKELQSCPLTLHGHKQCALAEIIMVHLMR